MAKKRDLEISGLRDLYALKHAVDCDEVVLKTHSLKYKGVLRYALKYALWAVKPGGRVVVLDSGPREPRIQPYLIPFNLVLQQAFKLLGPDTEIEMLDHRHMTAIFRRTSPILPPGWSAAILFSGSGSEVIPIKRALDAMRRQPELAPDKGGQIIVAGPAEAQSSLVLGPDIEYFVFENTGARAMVTKKRNAVAAAARNPRLIVTHARVVLSDGCLAAMPREFDVITPRVEYQLDERQRRYVDFTVEDVLDGEAVSRHSSPSNAYDPRRYLSILSRGRPVIEGGIYAGRKTVLESVPFNPFLAAGEGEDLEWSARLHANGCLVDLEPDALAILQPSNLPRHAPVPRPGWLSVLHRPARVLRATRNRMTHLLESALRLR
jgi:hypothetical protein